MLEVFISSRQHAEDVFLARHLCVAIEGGDFIVLLLNGSSECEDLGVDVVLERIGAERVLRQIQPLIFAYDF